MTQATEKQWYYSRDGEQFGPVSQSELQSRLSRHDVAPGDLAWTEGMGDWQPVSSLADLQVPVTPMAQSPQAAPSHEVSSPEDSTQWYYTRLGQRQGPVSRPQLQQLINSGQVAASELAWTEGMGDWLAISSLQRSFSVSQFPLGYATAIGIQTAGVPGAPIAVYANFWWRLLSAIIDGIVTTVAGGILGTVIELMGSATLTGNSSGQVMMAVGSQLANIVTGWLYFGLMESSKTQGSLGKMACGLVVTDMNGNRISFGRATGRHFASYISAIICFIGYLMVFWTQQRQGLHDIMASTLVIKK
ncbi:MAG: RDD family protein [Burkholderiales bacterium]|nr:RDD family protein [Phycisphaerae bacterium]